MTVQSNNPVVNYTGNGVTTSFNAPSNCISAPLVILTDNTIPASPVVRTLVLNSDYTLTSVGGLFVTVSLFVAPKNAVQVLSILLNEPFTQLTHWVEGDPFPAASHEAAADHAVLLAQQLQGQIQNLASPGLTIAQILAPLASPAAGQGDALLAVKAPYPNAASRLQHNKNADVVSLTDWPGIDLTGVTDSTTAIQVAVNDATNTTNGYFSGVNVNLPTAVMPTPVKIRVPKGTLRIDGTIFCPIGCSFEFDGTIISLANNTTVAAFRYNPGYIGGSIFVCAHTTFRGCQVIGNSSTYNTNTYLWNIYRMPYFNGEDVTCFYTQIANVVGESILTHFFHVKNYRPVGIGWNLSNTPLVSAGSFVAGTQYVISVVGTTNWIAIGAASNTAGLTFTATGPGAGTGTAYIGANWGPNFCTCVSCYCEEAMYCNTIPAGSFISGNVYTILSPGTTNFVAIGAPSNTAGTVFVATGAGAGTGTAMTGVTAFVLSSGSMQILDTYMEAVKDFVLLSGGADFTIGSGCSLNMRNSVVWTNQSSIVSNLFAINTTGVVQPLVRMTDCTVSMTGNSIGGTGNSNFIFAVYTGGSGPNIQISNVQFICAAPSNTSEVTVFKLGANVTVNGAVSTCQFTIPSTSVGNTSRLNIMDTSTNAGSNVNVPFTGCTISGASPGSGNPDSINFEINGATTGSGFYTAPFIGNQCFRLTNFTKCANAVVSNNVFTNSQGLVFTDQITVANRCVVEGNTFLSTAPVFTNPGLIVNNQGMPAVGVIAAAATITPSAQVIGVNSSGTIQNITLGSWPTITLLPQAGSTWTTGVSGNIGMASTAIPGKSLILTWNTADSHWYPSY